MLTQSPPPIKKTTRPTVSSGNITRLAAPISSCGTVPQTASLHNTSARRELTSKPVLPGGGTSADSPTKVPTANESSRKSVTNLCHDPIEGPIKRTNCADFPSNYPAPAASVRTSMVKPSIYRGSQKRQGVITGTTRSEETLMGHVRQTFRIWQTKRCQSIPACLVRTGSLGAFPELLHTTGQV